MYMENKYSALGLNTSTALGFTLCYITLCFSFHWWQCFNCYYNITLVCGTSFLGHILPCVIKTIVPFSLAAQFPCNLLDCLISSYRKTVQYIVMYISLLFRSHLI